MKKTQSGVFAAGLLLLAVGALTTGCRNASQEGGSSASSTASTGSPVRGGTLVLTSGTDIAGINPLTNSGTSFSREIHGLMFLKLLNEQADYQDHPATFKPALAESHSWSEDNLVLTLKLRPDAVWSDGHPISAEDVAWTHKAQTSPEVAWGYAQNKDGIQRVEVVDPHTVRFYFSEIYPARLANVNEGVIMPKHAWQELPFSEWRRRDDWFRDHHVVSGPFALAEWRPQLEVVLEANPKYYRAGYPLANRVVIRIVPDRSNQLEQLVSGQVDYIRAMRPSATSRIEAAEQTTVVAYPHRQYLYLGWNGCRPPFDQPEVLRALTLSIDRTTLVRAIYSEYAKVAASPIISTVWAFNKSLEPWPYDPEEARRILAAAGWSDTDDDGILDREGKPFRFKLSTNSDNQMRVDAVTMIEQQLAKIGVDAEIDLMEFNTLIAKNEEGDFDVSLGSWAIDTTLDLSYAFHSNSIDGGQNYGCYRNPEVDRLIDLARRQAQITDAKVYLDQVQEILHQDQPYTFLWEPMRIDGANHRLRDARPTALSTYGNLEEWWLAPPG